MKYKYRPANFKDLKEALHYIMYTGSVFFRGEEITFQHLEGIQRPYGVGGKTTVEAIELRQLKNILNQLTIREEISELQLWRDQLKNGNVLCNLDCPILITEVALRSSGRSYGISSTGIIYVI